MGTGSSKPPPEAAPSATLVARRRGSLLAMAAYFALAGTIGAAAVVELTEQVFAAPVPEGPLPFSSCQQGLEALLAVIDQGRLEAENDISASREGSEEVALLRFRTVVQPVFRYQDALAELCGPPRRAALDAVEQLRYSEEHGVRHQATELARLRGRARQLVLGGRSKR